MDSPCTPRRRKRYESGESPLKRKRKSYTAEFKLKVINYAEIHGNREAGRSFDVDEKSVRQWRLKKNDIEDLPRAKRAKRCGKTSWPDLEKEILAWILSQRESGRSVSTVLIRLKAQTLAAEMGFENFHGGPSWCFRFMKRNNLSVRNRTTVGQSLPEDWEKKVVSFRDFVGRTTKKFQIKQNGIGNMDEVPMTFDDPPNRTVDSVGTQSVNVVKTGHEKTNFTVVLSCMGNGSKLQPMVIFKRLTVPRENFPSGIVVRCNQKGWMNETEMNVWINDVWRKRPGSFFSQNKNLLVMDSMAAHKQDGVKNELKKLNTEIAIIPGGLTKKLQPLDLTVNRVFKAKVRECWEKWMNDGLQSYTNTGRMLRASYAEVCQWVLTSWKHVDSKIIQKAFKKAGIFEQEDISDTDSEDEIPLAQIAGLGQDKMCLFHSDSESSDFDGW